MTNEPPSEQNPMHFHGTPLHGAFVIQLAKLLDERGYFARTFCEKQFDQQGLINRFVQSNMSYNRWKGTLRGMHFQSPPFEETKLIRCVRGHAFDVMIDLRPSSPSYGKWFGVELHEDDDSLIYIPAGMAHGFETLTDNTVLMYSVSAFYEPTLARGVRWNDPAFGIDWPIIPRVIVPRDNSYPDWSPDCSSPTLAATQCAAL